MYLLGCGPQLTTAEKIIVAAIGAALVAGFLTWTFFSLGKAIKKLERESAEEIRKMKEEDERIRRELKSRIEAALN